MKVTATHERDGHVVVVVDGPFALPDMQFVYDEVAKAAGLPAGSRILIDFRGVVGKMPSTMDRYQLGMWASRLPKTIRIACVARTDWIDPERFGQRVAQNRGLDLQVFDDDRAALAWLLEPPAPTA